MAQRTIFEFSKIQSLSHTTFKKIQAGILRPVVHEFWRENHKQVVQTAILNGLFHVCGDGQCDNAGHCAKYGIYSMPNQATGHILGHRLTQVTEAGNSNAIELFGFKRVLESLEQECVNISLITTDRQVSVR